MLKLHQHADPVPADRVQKGSKFTASTSTAHDETQPSAAVASRERPGVRSPRTLLSPVLDVTKQPDGRYLRVEQLEILPNFPSPQLKNGSPYLPKEGSENLYARLSELPLAPPPGRNLQGVQTLYLGESWLLTYVVQKVMNVDAESDSSSPSTIQVPLPASVGDKPENLGYDARLNAEEIECLNIRGAFILPENSVSNKLIQTFFERVFPAFPIFDREEFAQLYESGQQSLLVLNAIYAVASTICDEKVITKAGFEDRNAARKTFIKRAKALHDADHETNKVALIQSVFLLSFLWSGSMDEKDMFYWLSIAIGNAQGKGMHRSTKESTLRTKDRRLWKRIWWSLYVRDRHCSGNIGRPLRIRDDDYDVEPLEESDFEEEFTQNVSTLGIYGKQSRMHVLYVIAMSKLSEICKTSGKAPIQFPTCKTRPTLSCEELSSDLTQWRMQLPPELRNSEYEGEDSFWAQLLDLTYSQHVILLHRPENNQARADTKLAQSTAVSAAKRITSIVEDFLTLGLLRHSQLQIHHGALRDVKKD
ncbi:uncharacterized protein A1O9_07991 [Exophiala aquamarina CBS 119918]|uniref:Xylanolytic transcriptional activator regulatory domain-containing protein n=1 Tax=Exophiala aquamarina CBS 119918 TaxID=1182545 RepID=A0A072PLL1_9EURO|nr:uncharacterized protein A1O9_07991 [Exophiala aquamarina CBS 119918]KEF56410.1 hypothetical protein A1O9_07991 [Exophiala aquamarina CBS 119918]